MITPSRWFAGGWGLDQFRDEMIRSDHIREIHDFQNSGDCFSGVNIKGDISYFLYDRDNIGPCTFFSHEADKIVSQSERFLQEDGCDVLIRYNELIGIYRKVRSTPNFTPFSGIVSGRSPFGLNTNHYGHETCNATSDVSYFERKGFTSKTIVKGEYKVVVPSSKLTPLSSSISFDKTAPHLLNSTSCDLTSGVLFGAQQSFHTLF